MISDFHMHTTYSDGKNSISEMAEQAGRIGLKSVGISDHSRGYDDLVFFGTSSNFDNYVNTVRKMQRDGKNVRIGLECDIGKDGNLVVPDYLKGGESERYGLDYLIWFSSSWVF
ncbi:MAG: PHP domain-containing protein [Candidatus Pacearchaeota archaeon]|nr:PHP domain-containing protein [Candidatus Pacearchaeota archaeon]